MSWNPIWLINILLANVTNYVDILYVSGFGIVDSYVYDGSIASRNERILRRGSNWDRPFKCFVYTKTKII